MSTGRATPRVDDRQPPYDTVVFDCDSTLSAIEGIDELAGEHREALRTLTERAMNGEIPLEDVYGLRLERVRPTRDALRRVGELYVERLVPGMRELVADLRARGKRVIVVSGGLLPAVRRVAAELGVAAHDVHAVDVAFDDDGGYRDFDRSSPLARSGGKPELIASLARRDDLGAIALVGDGATDLEAAPLVARFVAFGAVVRRDEVFARSKCGALDVHELAGSLLSAEELGSRPMTSLWIPGPTHVRPRILAAQTEPMIGHRSGKMTALIERIDPHLPLLFGFEPGSGARAAVATGSATALMEAALHGAGERVLSIVGGAFAKRWYEIARTLGKKASAHEVTWGHTITPENLVQVIEREGPFDAVTIVANETSTGVVTPLAPIAAALREHAPQTHLLVDAVTLAAGQPVDLDAVGIDFVLTGSQKALALPPGLALCAASARYQERARSVESRSWYLDPLRILDGHEKRATPTTPAISLYQALAVQLEDIAVGAIEGGAATPAEGWAKRFARHERMQRRTLEWAHGHELCPYPAKPEWCSATVSCIAASGLDVGAFVTDLKAVGFEISNGYGDLKGKTFRIGHMGDHTEADLEALLAAATDAIARRRG
ncbi:MAG: HAD-IB family phosphatase [Planctomycetota bacterium]